MHTLKLHTFFCGFCWKHARAGRGRFSSFLATPTLCPPPRPWQLGIVCERFLRPGGHSMVLDKTSRRFIRATSTSYSPGF